MLEGIQDYELLHLLSQRDRAAADIIAGELVVFEHNRYRFDDSVNKLRTAQKKLLELLSKMQ